MKTKIEAAQKWDEHGTVTNASLTISITEAENPAAIAIALRSLAQFVEDGPIFSSVPPKGDYRLEMHQGEDGEWVTDLEEGRPSYLPDGEVVG